MSRTLTFVHCQLKNLRNRNMSSSIETHYGRFCLLTRIMHSVFHVVANCIFLMNGFRFLLPKLQPSHQNWRAILGACGTSLMFSSIWCSLLQLLLDLLCMTTSLTGQESCTRSPCYCSLFDCFSCCLYTKTSVRRSSSYVEWLACSHPRILVAVRLQVVQHQRKDC